MYVRTDGHLIPALLGRLCRRVNLKSTELSHGNSTIPHPPSVHQQHELSDIRALVTITST